MDMMEAIKLRRSIREYKNKPIPKEILEKIVDAARHAPTAKNIQPWEFIVITQSETLKKIGELAQNGRFLAQAKACIAVYCSDTKYYLEDGCAATENILLAATALGIGSCWIAGDKKPYCTQISSLLNVPPTYKLVSLISLGYPESEKEFRAADKKSLTSLIHRETF
ncbi:MAG: nitroreductase [Omnitrophica WOR_2 bacterium RIFCSPLOWO2_01_FULL_41_12]|nr:MAG: nitroreductase [Omnitrophica WOR_2 bacterium RIFCSPLOWO2_01_FULL_41_12]